LPAPAPWAINAPFIAAPWAINAPFIGAWWVIDASFFRPAEDRQRCGAQKLRPSSIAIASAP
jgi:hypothetical protein